MKKIYKYKGIKRKYKWGAIPLNIYLLTFFLYFDIKFGTIYQWHDGKLFIIIILLILNIDTFFEWKQPYMIEQDDENLKGVRLRGEDQYYTFANIEEVSYGGFGFFKFTTVIKIRFKDNITWKIFYGISDYKILCDELHKRGLLK